MKRVHIKTFGCQMNVYDSNRMRDILAAEGYSETATAEDADLVLLNTCHIREKAAEKVYSDIGRLKALRDARREQGGDMVIGVAGCVAQAEGKEIQRRAPAVDLVFGPQSYHRLPTLLRQQATQGRVCDTDFPPEDKFGQLPAPQPAQVKARGPAAFLTVQEGCDKFCTFCVVPYTRGAEFSRPVRAVVDEAQRLVDGGVRDITLLGQNVNAYHGEGPDGAVWSLGRLLFRLAEIPGLARLRYTTSHPRDMHDELYAAHRDVPALMPYLHLPVQSGSDRMLKAMNRQHTAREYRAVIDRLRSVRPDIALSTDFIVGFPGETDDDFEASCQLADDMGYAASFSFKYSPRPGTPAAGMAEQVPEDVKTERLTRLQALLAHHFTLFSKSLAGQVLPVLLERAARRPGFLVGRTPYLQPIEVEASSERMGSMVDVKVDDAGRNSLVGRLVPRHTSLQA